MKANGPIVDEKVHTAYLKAQDNRAQNEDAN